MGGGRFYLHPEAHPVLLNWLRRRMQRWWKQGTLIIIVVLFLMLMVIWQFGATLQGGG